MAERVGWWAISVMRRSKSSKHGKTLNSFSFFLSVIAITSLRITFIEMDVVFQKKAVNWVKTPTFQLTFSNIAGEKSCVIEINRTSIVCSVDKYLSGWGWSSAYNHCTVRKLNRNEQRRRERYKFIYTFSFYCLSNIQSCTREKNERSYTDETQMIILGSLNSIRLLT